MLTGEATQVLAQDPAKLALPAADAKPNALIAGVLMPRLKGSWASNSPTQPVGAWRQHIARERNQVIHLGNRPGVAEANAAVAALHKLEQHILDRLSQQASIFPRTALQLGQVNNAIGCVEGHRVAIVPDHLSPSASKDSRLLFVAFQKQLLDLDLEIFPEDTLFLQAAQSLTGAQDIQSGIAEVDEKAVIRGRNEESVKSLLARAQVSAAIQRLIAHDGKFLINDRGAFITVSAASLGRTASRDLLDSLVEVVTTLSAA